MNIKHFQYLIEIERVRSISQAAENLYIGQPNLSRILKEIELDVEMEDITYHGNESLMAHVWDNLISNAVKFNSHGGLLRLRLRQQEERIVFTVEDEGQGISQEDQAHIFDKFYQADSSHKQEGNGLGLSLVKRIITACNGEITVENRKEGGARFTVVLPQE